MGYRSLCKLRYDGVSATYAVPRWWVDQRIDQRLEGLHALSEAANKQLTSLQTSSEPAKKRLTSFQGDVVRLKTERHARPIGPAGHAGKRGPAGSARL